MENILDSSKNPELLQLQNDIKNDIEAGIQVLDATEDNLELYRHRCKPR